MGQRGRGLADRFRRAWESEAQRAAREADEARRKQEREAAARAALFEDLVAFAEGTGFLRARLRDGALTLEHGARAVRFEPVGDGDDVAVHWEGQDPEETHRLYLEDRLGDAWVWGRQRRLRQREDRELLWDAGLEELLIRSLGLPRPGDDDEGGGAPPDAGSRGKRL